MAPPEVAQIQLHMPSEHFIDSHGYGAELQIVHRTAGDASRSELLAPDGQESADGDAEREQQQVLPLCAPVAFETQEVKPQDTVSFMKQGIEKERRGHDRKHVFGGR